MPIRVLLPAPLRRQESEPPRLRSHPRKTTPAMPVLGLIDNTKAKSADILDLIGRGMLARGVVGSYFVWQKPSAGRTITSAECTQILARAHVIVSGIGD